MAYDNHVNFAYSTVLTAPSPATSGTSVVVQSGDGTKFSAASFNATVCPAGAQPTTANAEIVRITVISTDTFTITRAQEGTSARAIVVGDQIIAGITKKTIYDVEGGSNGLSDYVVSGCIWSGNAYASTRVASMTAGIIWLNKVQLSVAAVTSRTFTASKDTYVDLTNNGDGTAALTYIEVTNGAASPALTSNGLRIGYIITGATTIAAATSILQTGFDSLYNPMYPPSPTFSANPWLTPSYTNSWVNFGSGFATGGYMKDRLGFVHLNGLISTGTIGTAAFTLPVGYRPALTQDLGTISNNATGVVQVTNTGVVTPSTGSSTWVSLCGLTYRAEL
jgi:hypothetical protein